MRKWNYGKEKEKKVVILGSVERINLDWFSWCVFGKAEKLKLFQ